MVQMTLLKINAVLVILLGLYTASESCACHFDGRLIGKWYFTGQNRNINIRIRSKVVVFKVSHHLKLRYKCTERYGNIYLLRNSARGKKHEVLCLGFIYVADNPRGEYLMSRMIGRGFDSFIFSPKNVTRKYVTIDNSCDSEISRERKFIYRKEGCRLPQKMIGTWGFTFRQSSAITMGKRNFTIHFLNNENLTLNCEAKDGNMFLFRRSGYMNSSRDAILCVTIEPVLDDPFYDYEFTRVITGNAVDNLIKTVQHGKKLYMHSDCDMIYSPARPEYIYKVNNIL